jgi:glycosyltransferase involved in cell wall biosynthesis
VKILIIGGWSKSLINFRGPLIRAMRDEGHTVIATAAEEDPEVRDKLASWGVTYHAIPLSRASTNPFADVKYLRSLIALMRREAPELVLAYTHKPVIFGTWAAYWCGIERRAAMITGLGYAFIGTGGLRQRLSNVIVSGLYKALLRRNEHVFFQNSEDRDLFVRKQLLGKSTSTSIVAGSGVDLSHFTAQPPPKGSIRFLLIARLLRDKGIMEYAEAAKRIRERHPDVSIELVGPLDPNPTALREKDVRAWEEDGRLRYRGEKIDVRPDLAAASVFVLPSYREGTPRTVLEAMATGRAIITTDVPGCRQTIENGIHGFLVKPRSSHAIEEAMQRFVDDPELHIRMGSAALERARAVYDVRIVNKAILETLGLKTRPQTGEEI